jgi:hypothetical protein
MFPESARLFTSPPARGLKPATTAPVDASTAASRVRDVPPTFENDPPR